MNTMDKYCFNCGCIKAQRWMSKLVKCDRCHRIDDGARIYSFGTDVFYVGDIIEYSYIDSPGFREVDLCRNCGSELDRLAQNFMKGESYG